jgi:cell division protein FtsB
LETAAMKWLWDLFEGIQVNAVLREKISLAEQKFKDMETENKKLKEQITVLTAEVAGLRNQVSAAAGSQPPHLPFLW